MPDVQTFALALRSLDGVGRVTAARVLERFPTYADLRRYPREQVLHRLKGAPNAAALVDTLFEEAAMTQRLEAAAAERAALQQKRVNLRAPADPDWPTGLAALPRSERPFLLFTYGDARVLNRPGVAFFGRPGLDPDAYELVQVALRRVVAGGRVPIAGLATGFDVVMHKIPALTPAPSLMVAACGLSKVAPPMRPVASQSIRAGGLLVSPFEMEHGPFEHDDRERGRVMAALASALVLSNPDLDPAEKAALDVARTLDIPVFAADAALARAEGLRPFTAPADLD